MRRRNIFKTKRRANCLPHALLFQKGHEALFGGTVPKVSLHQACGPCPLNRSVTVAPDEPVRAHVNTTPTGSASQCSCCHSSTK